MEVTNSASQASQKKENVVKGLNLFRPIFKNARYTSCAPLVLFLLNLSLALWCFFPVLARLEKDWQRPEYGHGYMIPFLALLIGWHRLVEKKPKAAPSWMGPILVFLSSMLFVLAELSAFEPPARYGFILALVGLTLAHFGRSFAYALAPAFIYLLFVIPLPSLVYHGLSEKLQLISSSLGVLPLQLLGIPVFQEGNVIDLGTYKLQVVEACSGLRYLFPLMSFGFLIAFLVEDKMWKRIVIFLSTIPITIAMNALRIAIIGLTVDRWGIQMADGLLHDFEGWVVFVFCVALLFAETKLLLNVANKDGKKGKFRYDYLTPARGALLTGGLRFQKSGFATLALYVLLVLLLATGALNNRTEVMPTHPPFDSFPTRMNDWRGEKNSLSLETLTALKLSDYWMADYSREGDASSVSLYMAYYASQRVGTTIHSPGNCLPGSGWKIDTQSVVPVDFGSRTGSITRMTISKGEHALLVYYWLDGRGRIINDLGRAKWYLFVDSMNLHRTDGALVRLMTPLSQGEREDTADQRLRDFLKDTYPEIKSYIPGK